jgi:hypothetical protein
MKNKSIILAAIFMALPSTMMAQKNVKKAFDDFLAQKNFISLSPQHLLEKDPETGKKESQSDVYDFTAPTTYKRLLTAIEDAIQKDSEAAYQIASGENNGPTNYVTLAVGDDSSSGVAIGKNEGSRYTYACFVDKNDPDKKYRYAYAVDWVERDGKIIGRLAITYALMPKFRQSRGITINGNKITLPTDIGGITASKKMSTTDFLSQFNTLSGFYRNNLAETNGKGSAATASFAMQIYSLCKDAPSLNDYEKNSVTTELKELRKLTKRDSLQGFFTRCIELIEQ